MTAWHGTMAQQGTTWIEQVAANNKIIIVTIIIQSNFLLWHLSFQDRCHRNSPATSSTSRHKSGGFVIVANISGWLLCNGGDGHCHCHCHHHTLSSPMEDWRRRYHSRAVPCGNAIVICHHYLLPANASGWLLCNGGDGCIACRLGTSYVFAVVVVCRHCHLSLLLFVDVNL